MSITQKSCDCTVIVAVYNGADYLAESLQTIVEQDVLPRQVIIVDDGSTDDSPNVISAFKEAHGKNLDVLTLTQENSGQSSARNLAIGHVKHEYVAFLDQDDLWNKNHLKILLEGELFHQQTGWVYTDFDLIDKSGKLMVSHKLRSSGYVPPEQNLESMLSRDLMMLPTASIVKLQALKVVNGFDTQFKGYEDDDLFLRIHSEGYSFAFVAENTIRYRVHDSNSSGGISFAQSRMKFFNKYQEYLEYKVPNGKNISRDSLAPRITSGILHDLFVAVRDKNASAEKYALENLNRIFLIRGKSLKRRAILLLANIQPLYNILYRAYLKRTSYINSKKRRHTLRDTK